MNRVIVVFLVALLSMKGAFANQILSPSARSKIIQTKISYSTFVAGLAPYQRICFDELVVWCPELESEIIDERAENLQKQIIARGDEAKKTERHNEIQAELNRRAAIVCRINTLSECGVDVTLNPFLRPYLPSDYTSRSQIGYK